MARSSPNRLLRRRCSAVGIALVASAPALLATYSIVACDNASGECGVAVQTDNLAVGASVPYAQAGVGAIASQFETNPRHGPRGLALLAAGTDARETLALLLSEDGQFEGRGIEARQLAVVAMTGQACVHTGADAAQAGWAGARAGNGYSVQGNGLAGPQVLEAMEQTFLATTGPLAERLLAALSAGDRAGGQRTGRESAALLVRTRDGFPLDVDLRVDHAADPVTELQSLYRLQAARQQIIAARLAGRRGDIATARAQLADAVNRVAEWPRGAVLAAEVAIELEQPGIALECLERAFTLNPQRASVVIGTGKFALLGHESRFHHWVPAAIVPAENARTSERAAALLEAGQADSALTVLQAIPPAMASAFDFLLLTTAHEARGDVAAAISACEAGLQSHPRDQPLTLRLTRLRSLES